MTNKQIAAAAVAKVKMMGLGIPRAVIAEGFGIGLRTVFRVLNSSLEGVA